MRPAEPKTFDPHEHIDLLNEEKVREMLEKFDCSDAELREAVEKVGPQPVAVAIFLGRSHMLDISP